MNRSSYIFGNLKSFYLRYERCTSGWFSCWINWSRKIWTIIRNAGGLEWFLIKALNLFWFFLKILHRSITPEKMFSLMKKTSWLEIKAYEVVFLLSGKFDLSVRKKIAGIAQRRVKDGVVVMYLSVNGDQFARGQMVKQFIKKFTRKLRFKGISWCQTIFNDDFVSRSGKKFLLQKSKNALQTLEWWSWQTPWLDSSNESDKPVWTKITTNENRNQQLEALQMTVSYKNQTLPIEKFSWSVHNYVHVDHQVI